MKIKFLESVDRKPHPLFIWGAFHLILILTFTLFGSVKVNTSLYSMLPDTAKSRKLAVVEKNLTSNLNSSIMVLIGYKDFSDVKSIAKTFRDIISDNSGLVDISLELESDSMSKIQEHLHKFRYNFYPDSVKKRILGGKIDELSQRAFLTITSPISMGYLDYIESDPFFLTYESFLDFMNSGILANMSLGIKDNFMTRDLDGVSWILLTMKTADTGITSKLDESPISSIYKAAEDIKNQFPGTEFLFSGVPFHTWESTKESKHQISLLSTISTIFILIIIIGVFKSVKPLLFTITSISFGLITGLILTMLFFREIHIFTIVFGTSLIGVSVDYCFHFFSEWTAKGRENSNLSIIKYVKPGITVGLITTLISYGAFIVTPFLLLQQIALFSISGLFSSYLSVIYLFPVLGAPTAKSSNSSLLAANRVSKAFLFLSKYRKTTFYILLLSFISLIFIGFDKLEFNNNIRDLYQMSKKLMNWEKRTASILEHGSTGLYMIVEGENLEDNLEKAENVSKDLDILVEDSRIKSYLSLATFLPSLKVQKENLELTRTALSPYLAPQLELYGFDSNSQTAVISRNFMTLEDLNSLPLGSLLSKVDIGEIDSKYYSAIQIFGVENSSDIVGISDDSKGIYFVDKVEETSNTLQNLSRIALIIILISYFVIFLTLIPRYSPRKALKIVVIPILASLLTLLIVAISGHPINIFVVVGFILIPGMGTDYLILIMESKTLKPQVLLTITMSMSTTVLSFGMLAFTSMAGTFGLTVSLGVFFTYLLTAIFSRSD